MPVLVTHESWSTTTSKDACDTDGRKSLTVLCDLPKILLLFCELDNFLKEKDVIWASATASDR